MDRGESRRAARRLTHDGTATYMLARLVLHPVLSLTQLWMFWIAPVLGAGCAGLCYRLFAGSATDTADVVVGVTIEQTSVGVRPFETARR
jgi:hypothetical protein